MGKTEVCGEPAAKKVPCGKEEAPASVTMKMVQGVTLEAVVYGGETYKVPLDTLRKAHGQTALLAQMVHEGGQRGLAHLRRHGVLHRDVKPGNIMLQYDGRFDSSTVAFVDYGFARDLFIYAAQHRSQNWEGTPSHWPCVVILALKHGYNEKPILVQHLDVYALAITVVEVLLKAGLCSSMANYLEYIVEATKPRPLTLNGLDVAALAQLLQQVKAQLRLLGQGGDELVANMESM